MHPSFMSSKSFSHADSNAYIVSWKPRMASLRLEEVRSSCSGACLTTWAREPIVEANKEHARETGEPVGEANSREVEREEEPVGEANGRDERRRERVGEAKRGEVEIEEGPIGEANTGESEAALEQACNATVTLIRQPYTVSRVEVVGRAAMHYVNRRETGAPTTDQRPSVLRQAEISPTLELRLIGR